MQVLEHPEHCGRNRKYLDDECVFDKTKAIIRLCDSIFMAMADNRMGTVKTTLEIAEADAVGISPETFCPPFEQGLTRALTPVPEGIYVKKPSLLGIM